MGTKYVVMVQCDLSRNRCSGFACTETFYNKEGLFKVYDDTTRYISFTCGGCSGKGVSGRMEHFSNKLKKKTNIDKDDVVVHLASCMVTDNYHSDRCPHVDFIKNSIEKKGFMNIVEKTYISKTSTKKRELGIYKSYE